MTMELKGYAYKTDQGPFLNVNEDFVEVDLTNKIYTIMDGFGGSGIGDKAVVDINNEIKKIVHQMGKDPDSTFPFYYGRKHLLEANVIINAVLAAHNSLLRQNASKGISDRGGSSIVIGIESDNILSLISVGNCVCFLYRANSLNPICRPDNFEYLRGHDFQRKFQTFPCGGIGLFEDLNFSVDEIRILPGDQVLFLTDGIYSQLKLGEIKFLLDKIDMTYKEKIEELFKMANDRENLDNLSAMLLEY